eukprot:9776350-Heterocapsa_arctica.AAC.1
MNKCECPIDGRQQTNIVDSNDLSNKQFCPGQDIQSDAGEGKQLDHAVGSSGSKGPMESAIVVDDEEGDLEIHGKSESYMEHGLATSYDKGKEVRKIVRQKAEINTKAKSE